MWLPKYKTKYSVTLIKYPDYRSLQCQLNHTWSIISNTEKLGCGKWGRRIWQVFYMRNNWRREKRREGGKDEGRKAGRKWGRERGRKKGRKEEKNYRLIYFMNTCKNLKQKFSKLNQIVYKNDNLSRSSEVYPRNTKLV